MIALEGCEVLGVLAETESKLLIRARRAADAAPVVVKLLRSEHPTPEEVARLHHECAVASGLVGNGFVRPLAVERFGRRVGLVLEDTGGVSLASTIGPEGMEIGAFLRLARALAETVARLHESGVIHRDVKPSNVIVDDLLAEARLTDFGIATRLPRLHQEAQPPTRLQGTLAYMSPEQTGRMNRSVDQRSDLYSLGVTYYQMLTGRLPFRAGDALELVHCHLAVMPVPPAEVRPEVPGAVSDMVLRLLAKSPEDRYQSALGLAQDLAEAASRWAATATVGDFVLGAGDVPTRLRIPERLYGRDAEIAALTGAVAEAGAGGRRLVLLSGTGGVGKTVLVGEVHGPIAQLRGHLIEGKFDQYSRNVPYASLVDAFGGLVRQLLSEPAERVTDWRASLEAALGPNTAVVAEMIPDLRLVLGETPPATPLPPAETQNRFNLTFRQFIGTLARPEQPLVVFLDDLHWADAASLKLLETVLSDPDLHHILLIGAYHPGELSESHPLTVTLAAVDPAVVRRVEVGPLGEAVVTELVADTLRTGPAEAQPLARFLHDRTGGNPFFLRQLLASLDADGLVRVVRGSWSWNLDAIQAHGLTGDVVTFMVGRLGGLPPATQEALRIAAVVGNRFDLTTVAAVLDRPGLAVAGALWPALAAGLVLPVGENPELVGAGLEGTDVAYRFVHDRIQQAAHSTIGPEEIPRVHLRVGTLLREHLGDDDQGLFEVVEHLNAAAALVVDDAGRLDLARINLRAARRAKAGSAYEAAAHHLARARDQLPPHAWTADYALTFELHHTQGEVLAALNRMDEAEASFEALQTGAGNDDDAAFGWAVWAEARFGAGRVVEALKAAKAGLARLGIPLPPAAETAAATTAVMARLLDPAAVGRLAALPVGDERAVLTGRLFASAVIAAYFTDAADFRLVTASAVEHILTTGTSPHAVLPVTYLGMEAARSGHLELGIAYSEAVLTLAEDSGSSAMQGTAGMLAWVYCLGWKYTIDEHIGAQREAFWACQQAGAPIYANYALGCEAYAEVTAGRDQQRVRACFERSFDHGLRFAPQLVDAFRVYCDVAGEIMAMARDPVDRAAIVEAYAPNPILQAILLLELARSQALLGNYGAAHAHGTRGIDVFAGVGGASTGHWLLHGELGLAVAASRLAATATDPALRSAYLADADAAVERFRPFAEFPPRLFGAYGSLMQAEQARAHGDLDTAVLHHLAAIDQAAAHRYTLLEGWANELLGRTHHDAGRRLALPHLREARDLFAQCGARAKVVQLEEEFPGLVAPRAPRRVFDDTRTTTDQGPATLDLATVVKASQAIASEIDYDRVVARLVAISVENAGAERGVFVAPGEERDDVPATVIAFATRTGEAVVVADAAGDLTWAADPYVAARRPRSVLALPIARNNATSGVLYLENTLLPGVFTPERLALLRLLSTQMAISLENARLYAGLEAEVAERTAELTGTLDDLRSAQAQIVESEKLAALGGLVAGVAHEINTPVGIAVTAASHLSDRTADFTATFAAGTLRRSALDAFVQVARDSGELILANLRRATELVSSFKQVAVDQSSEARRTFAVQAYLEDIVASLGPKLKPTPHAVEIACDPELVLVSYPGALAQVATNLVMNSLVHAYPEGQAGTLRFAVTGSPGGVRIVYSDDGAGIPADVLPSIFEPFFTTKRGEGGSGLGLHIVHNLVTQRLGGTLGVVAHPGGGTRFTIDIPHGNGATQEADRA